MARRKSTEEVRKSSTALTRWGGVKGVSGGVNDQGKGNGRGKGRGVTHLFLAEATVEFGCFEVEQAKENADFMSERFRPEEDYNSLVEY